MKKIISTVVILFFTGCSSSHLGKIEKVNTAGINLTTIRWGSDDLQEIAQRVVSDILNSSIDFTKTYSFGKIRNDSHDHIDTKHLVNKIMTLLLQSSKIKISENEKHKSKAVFYGKISSIFKKNTNTKDMFFNFNLLLTEVQTSKVVWSTDVEIRKVQTRDIFGK